MMTQNNTRKMVGKQMRSKSLSQKDYDSISTSELQSTTKKKYTVLLTTMIPKSQSR